MATAFTYQGQLEDNGSPANGQYDFEFKLCGDPVAAGTLATTTAEDHPVDDGLFTVEVDFGSEVFNGDARWLELGVRPGASSGADPYTTLTPRQELTPTPYASYAENAGGILNGCTCSGTMDHIAKFVGSDELGNSIIYENPSTHNVGIGTTDPRIKLDIVSETYEGPGIGLTNLVPGKTSWDIDNNEGVFKIVEHATCAPEFSNNPRITVVGSCLGSPYGGNVGIGTTTPGYPLEMASGAHVTAAGIWTNASDRNLKENFQSVDGREVLVRLSVLPITTWNGKAEDASIRHMGPMAQDLYTAFGLGDSEKSIGTIDADGVALAAIQGLYEVVKEKDAQIAELAARLAALEQLMKQTNPGQEGGGR